MILEVMFKRYSVLLFFKNNLVKKGYSFKQLSYINSQIELLEKLIKQESLNVLNILLREKTNYRLLRQINKGLNNLINILNYPNEWYLCKIDNCREEWLNQESLVFSTERETLVFTKINYNDSQKYINNKWQ